MAARPTWSGALQISLVSIEVRIFSASHPGRQVEFHQIDRKTHQRVHHQNVDDSGTVERAEIVKGYEYARGKYIEIDPEDLKALRMPTATTMQIQQFVKADELAPMLFERPYFVVPRSDSQAKALAVMRKALADTRTLGIGEIAFSGREHLVAIGAPLDPKQKGLMLYVLRYEEELRDPKSVLSGMKDASVSAQEVTLAKQIIDGSTSRFDLSAYKDDYEAAVKKLANAKRKGKALPEPPAEKPKAKVVNIMDALRQSLAQTQPSTRKKKTRGRKKAA